MKVIDIFLDTVDSTNAFAKKNCLDFQRDAWTVILAKEQTLGKGQFGRSWISSSGNLMASVVFFVSENVFDSKKVALDAGFSLAQVLRKEGVKDVFLKWPNDLLICGKKVAGILVETVSVDGGMRAVIVGVGLNIHLSEEALSAIGKEATTLFLETGILFDPKILLGKFIGFFSQEVHI